MRLPTLLLFAAALASAFSGCAALAEYDRSYTLSVSDGKQSVGLGVTLRAAPRKADKRKRGNAETGK